MFSLTSAHVLSSRSQSQVPKVPKEPTLKSKPWCGRYCIDSAQYNPDSVGPQALKMQELRKKARGCLNVEATVSIPFRAIQQAVDGHYENCLASSKIRSTCSHDISDHANRSSQWKKCRSALKSLKIPDLMMEDILSSMFAERMAVPGTKRAWEALRVDIAECCALLFTPTYNDTAVRRMNPLELSVSLLIKDMRPREYDFVVSVDTDGNISGDVRLPFSTNRGMTFSNDGPGSCLATVRPPCPHLGPVKGTSRVILDGASLPQAVTNHHAQQSWNPPKITFEGDNMLLVPQYKQQVYNLLGDTVKRASDLLFHDSLVVVSGYITDKLDVVITEISDDAEQADSISSMWSFDACELNYFDW